MRFSVSEEQIDKAVAQNRARALADEKHYARLRLTCAALTGYLAHAPAAASALAEWSIADADACLALLYPEAEGKEKE